MQKDDEPDFYVSVPGVRRQQSGLARGSSNLSSMSSIGCGTATASAAAAAAAASPLARAAAGSSRQAQAALERQPTLGSGTAVHGFKGLFRNIIVGSSSSGQSPPQAARP